MNLKAFLLNEFRRNLAMDISRYDDVLSEIKELEEELEYLDEEIKQFRLDIATINQVGQDEFTDKFTKVSMFCAKNDYVNPILQNVKLTNDSLMALNNYICVEMKCEIPEKLQNKYIKHDVRSNFEDNVVVADRVFPDIKILSKFKIRLDSKTTQEWIEMLLELSEERTVDQERKIVVVKFGEVEIGLNKNYLALILNLFEDNEVITVYWDKTPVGGLLFQTETIKALILPIRLSKMGPVIKY